MPFGYNNYSPKKVKPMNWHSWQEFWQMGGYAGYVWPAFAACFVAVLWELASLRLRRKAARTKALLSRAVRLKPTHLMTVDSVPISAATSSPVLGEISAPPLVNQSAAGKR